MTKALIVVDTQNDFVSGALAVPAAETTIRAIKNHIENHRENYDFIIATRDWHVTPGDHFNKWPVHCVADTQGAEFAAPLDDSYFDAIFHKGENSEGYSGFEGKLWDEHIPGVILGKWLNWKGVTAVDICGISLDHCVLATAADAVRNHLDTTVLLGLTCSTTGEWFVKAVHKLEDRNVSLRLG